MSNALSWLAKQFSTITSDDSGTLILKGTVAFLVVGALYVLLGQTTRGPQTMSPELVAANLEPIGKVAVATPPPSEPAPEPAQAEAPAEPAAEPAQAEAPAEPAAEPAPAETAEAAPAAPQQPAEKRMMMQPLPYAGPGTFTVPTGPRALGPSIPAPVWAPQFSPMPPRQ